MCDVTHQILERDGVWFLVNVCISMSEWRKGEEERRDKEYKEESN